MKATTGAPAAGLIRTKRGHSVRIRCGAGRNPRVAIALHDAQAASARAARMAELARLMVAAGRSADAPVMLKAAGAESSEAEFETIVAYVHELAARANKGGALATAPTAKVTFQALAERWLSGELARVYPDHVRIKRTVRDDRLRLGRLFKTIGGVALVDFRLADAKRAMAAIPEGRTPATRRQYGQLIARLLKMAVFPCEIIESYPLPPGFLPKTGQRPALSYLYPAEDARLLGCTLVPFELRLLYGFLAREGLRLGEALELRWRHFDLKHGTVRLERTKTGDARAWALDPGVAAAMRAVSEARASKDGDALVFPDAGARPVRVFRSYLKTAGVHRAELFERNAHRRPIRLHDQRAGYCTLALASGRSESHVMDRTGHTTSAMLNKYRRQSRHAAELGLGWFRSLIEALPELAELRATAPGGEPQGEPETLSTDSDPPVTPRDGGVIVARPRGFAPATR